MSETSADPLACLDGLGLSVVTYALFLKTRNPFRRARFSTVDLLVLTSLDKLHCKHNLLSYKTSYLKEELNRTEPSLK